MKSLKDIKKIVKQFNIKPEPEMRTKVLNEALQIQRNQNQQSTSGTYTWRTIMKSKMTKFAAAAVMIIAVLIGMDHFGGSIDGASVAWANVLKQISQVDYVHFHKINCSDKGVKGVFEGWKSGEKIVYRGHEGIMTYDDGQIQQSFDLHKTSLGKDPSPSTIGRGLFETLSRGYLSQDNEQFIEQVPSNVGNDFLIYTFDPPDEDKDWLEKVSVTVGKNSLLPVQIKIYYKWPDGEGGFREQGYWLIIFDYEASEKPPEFFESPINSEPPHGKGEIVLDGDEVMIDIADAPGIKTAIVRLHDQYDGPDDRLPLSYRKKHENSSESAFWLDVTFITSEGLRSITSANITTGLNEGGKCGLGGDNWADGKYRNIRFTPVIRSTGRKNVYIVEISCWLRSK